MKKIFFFLKAAICILAIVSCNPNAGKELVYDVVKLKATISNTNESIQLGDTLTVRLTLPDTITGSLQTRSVQSLQRGFFAMRTFKVDTVNKKGVSILFPTIWTSIGTTEGALNYVLKNTTKPFEVIINLKPTEKGIYYFEVVPQSGVLKINGGNESNLLVGFNVADKHYNLLNIIAPYFGGQPFSDAILQRDSEGFGVYFFQVN